MESQRNLLLLALLFVSFLLYQAWLGDTNPQQDVQQQTAAETQQSPAVPSSSNLSADVPNSTPSSTSLATEDVPATASESASIMLENDRLRIAISLIGGDVVSADLLEHNDQLDSDTPFRLLENSKDFTYIAQSGLIGQGK